MSYISIFKYTTIIITHMIKKSNDYLEIYKKCCQYLFVGMYLILKERIIVYRN